MRKQLCDALVARAGKPDMVFLTGDLGFMALEPLQAAMGERFINAGVAEQNLVSVAAGMSRLGLEVWTYSIAPFLYARPFEQIRNDVCFHGLPVKLIGNGGGYGYGVMGSTHHAIEDYGVLLTLPGMHVIAPVFDEDVGSAVARAGEATGPCYLRLGRGEPPKGFLVPAYAPWRCLVEGEGAVVIAFGPLAGTYIETAKARGASLWAVAELPLDASPPPAALLAAIAQAKFICIAEEHVRQGGLASALMLHLALAGVAPRQISHLYARAHNFGRYGSQGYLRRQAGIDPASLAAALDQG